jgi:multiple sugar transport system ATP-binding protein
MARLEIDGVSKSYGEVAALEDVQLTVEDNEFFCVFGPPGGGKTTLLRVILGLETPDQGSVRIADRDVGADAPEDRNLAMVFQNLALFPHMTAAENLAFPLVERKVPRNEILRRVEAVADKLHIGPLLGKIPAHLSGGERQRVAIGRALVRDADALLMDEPISALDARLREEMRVELKRLQREMHRTLVYVTHDQEEAMSVGDRLCILRHGRVAQVGPPDELYRQPHDRFVAELLGSPPVNLMAGTVRAHGGLVEATGLDLALGFDGVESGPGAEVLIGIRPEHIAVVGPEATDGGRHLGATIYEVEPLGAFTVVDLAVGGGPEKGSQAAGGSILRAQLTGQPQFALGAPVGLKFNLERCHLFDRTTGLRIATGAAVA